VTRLRLVVALLLALATPARAQLSAPLMLSSDGSAVLAQRPYWIFQGANPSDVTCSAAIVAGKPTNRCTITGGSGATTTLQQAYANGAAATGGTIALSANGSILVRDTAGGLGGDLFAVQSSGGGSSFLGVSATAINAYVGIVGQNSANKDLLLNAGAAAGSVKVIGSTGTNLDVGGAKFLVAGASGTVTEYNSEPTQGVGVPYIEAIGLDVAWVANPTTIATYTPTNAAGGVYQIVVTASAHTNTDTITISVTYTDAVEAFATTLTPLNGVTLTHDSNTGTASAMVQIRASNATAIVVKFTSGAQVTTKASAEIVRLQ
jgi:hypothetical protein